jgi:hypothetical protein
MISLAKRIYGWRWFVFASWGTLWISLQTPAAWRSDIRWNWILAIDACWLIGIPLSIMQARLRARHERAAEDAG